MSARTADGALVTIRSKDLAIGTAASALKVRIIIIFNNLSFYFIIL